MNRVFITRETPPPTGVPSAPAVPQPTPAPPRDDSGLKGIIEIIKTLGEKNTGLIIERILPPRDGTVANASGGEAANPETGELPPQPIGGIRREHPAPAPAPQPAPAEELSDAKKKLLEGLRVMPQEKWKETLHDLADLGASLPREQVLSRLPPAVPRSPALLKLPKPAWDAFLHGTADWIASLPRDVVMDMLPPVLSNLDDTKAAMAAGMLGLE